ncbi:histidine phosphatase family protein [Magnetococcales bacterium HHB-1]
MMKLWLTRHLQTDWNREGKLQGWQDTDVIAPDEAVWERINANRQQIDTAPPVKVFVSALKRTHQTARYYGFENVIQDQRLNECHFGRFSGTSRKAAYAHLGESWKTAPLTLTLGEPMTGFQARILSFIQDLEGEAGPIAVFSHGGWIRALLSIVETGDINTMNQRELLPNSLVSVTL